MPQLFLTFYSTTLSKEVLAGYEISDFPPFSLLSFSVFFFLFPIVSLYYVSRINSDLSKVLFPPQPISPDPTSQNIPGPN